MPVDRRLRDELAQVLAAHMRNGSDAQQLLEQLRSLHEQLAATDPDAAEIADDVIFDSECDHDRATLDSLSRWNQCRRHIAFLLSDLSLPPPPPPPPTESTPLDMAPHGLRLARVLL